MQGSFFLTFYLALFTFNLNESFSQISFNSVVQQH